MSGSEVFGYFISQVLSLFIRAWVAMVVLGAVIPDGAWHPGYWQAFGLAYVAGALTDNWISVKVGMLR